MIIQKQGIICILTERVDLLIYISQSLRYQEEQRERAGSTLLWNSNVVEMLMRSSVNRGFDNGRLSASPAQQHSIMQPSHAERLYLKAWELCLCLQKKLLQEDDTQESSDRDTIKQQ